MYLLTTTQTTTVLQCPGQQFAVFLSTQQIATLLESTCTACLASQFRHVDISGVVECVILEGIR